MNKLPLSKRTQILNMLVEGSSMRSISRVAGVSINTVTKLLVDAGKACQAHHNEHVQGVTTHRVECDEIITHRPQWSSLRDYQGAPLARPSKSGSDWASLRTRLSGRSSRCACLQA